MAGPANLDDLPLFAAVAEPAFAAKQEEIIDAFVAEADRRFGT